jgi:hypothetical protein
VATYRVLWLEIAEQQYMDLPHAARDLVDEILVSCPIEPEAADQGVSQLSEALRP